jgi:glycosyltransferase involved in cell wall biosynthesis
MKRDLLVVCGKLSGPPYRGLTVRYAEFLKGLSDRWRLWVIAYAPPQRREGAIDALSPFCQRLEVMEMPPEWSKWRRYLSLITHRAPYHDVLPRYLPEFRERLRGILKTIRPDAALFLYVPMADYRYELPPSIPKIIDHPDAFSPAFFQAARQSKRWYRRFFAWVDAWKFREFQRRAAQDFDLNIVVTKEDHFFLQNLCPSAHIAVLPNGVDINQFDPSQIQTKNDFEAADLLLVGPFTYAPNIDAAKFLCEDILPFLWRRQPSITAMLIGWQFNEEVKMLASERILLLEKVPDIRPFYKAAKIFVAPYRFVFGIRQKILEAMAMGKAIVGTSAAFMGIPVRDGIHALVRDNPEEFADAILTLLEDEDLRRSLGKAARELVAELFDWRQIVGQLKELLETTRR